MSNDRLTADIIAEACVEDDEEAYWSLMAELHERGSQREFAVAQELVALADPVKREIAADILGQLGLEEKRFHDESVDLLIGLLADKVDDVVAAAAFSLGHRNDSKAIPFLVPLALHANALVRNGVALGLAGFEDKAATDVLVALCADDDFEVRNWATFGLGSMCAADSVEIREALWTALEDGDAELRGEAFLGLAKRRDHGIEPLLKEELAGEFHGNWAVEAAGILADPVYYPLLQDLRKRIAGVEDDHFLADVDAAIKACKPKK